MAGQCRQLHEGAVQSNMAATCPCLCAYLSAWRRSTPHAHQRHTTVCLSACATGVWHGWRPTVHGVQLKRSSSRMHQGVLTQHPAQPGMKADACMHAHGVCHLPRRKQPGKSKQHAYPLPSKEPTRPLRTYADANRCGPQVRMRMTGCTFCTAPHQ